ncbi:Helicase associated domain protein [Streptomyces sp. NPDC057445]|uniref:DEAD/DEAH box helicase n=1 Tax=Streptomyces sp. NPDC057445 TaxID=3346136 RepID=UPI0036BE1AF6
MVVKLRDHQIEAVSAIVRGLDIPSGGIPVNGLRGQVHAACGTGKTIIAAAAAKRLVPKGRVLVLVPTLDLLTQTVKAWHAAGHTGPAVAVCSLQDDPGLWNLRVRCTTNPVQLALWHGQEPVTIYATYASLGVLAEAFEGFYGQQLAPVDLAVVDEAHRTSGLMGKAWADIHDQQIIPAARRLYLTATPRIWQERPPSWEVAEGVREALPEEMAASMDDEEVFGPVLFKLSLASAVARGLLARYQIIVVELQDPVVTPERLRGAERREEEVRGQRLGALQAALLRTMAEHRLQTTITFHHRTMEAQAYAEGLELVAGKLHADQPEKYPKVIWADWLCGEHVPQRRREVLGGFATTARRAVLSNCRVLGEGVDIRAVDSVALLDPKGAPHDIVQAIGRALRQKPGEGKLASLIVPVFLQPGEQPEDMFTSGSYRPLVKVLQGLRAHDEEAVELLAIPQEPRKSVVDPSMSIGPAPEEGEEESRLLLRFAVPRDPVMVAEWVSFHVIDTERQDWARGYGAARRYREREQHLRVPYDHKERPGPYPLGQWIAEQRRVHRAGQLTGKRAERLEALGMVWDAADAAFEENLAAARVYYEQHWTLCAPGATALDRPVGQWLSNCRRPGALAGHPERETALKEIDEDWNPAWPATWQRHYAALRELLAEEAGLTELLPGITVHGMDIGRWLERQRQHAVWAGLVEGQRERLEQLGIVPVLPAEEAPAKARRGGSGGFEQGIAALAQYKTRTGTVKVPRSHVETLEDGAGVRLGVWLSNTRTRRAKLTQEQRQALARLGLDWAGAA